MKIRWIGHAAFYIETQGGLALRTDPYDDSIGLPPSDLPADVVTISHDHFDHNAVDTAPGKPRVIRGQGVFKEGPVAIRGIASYHDDVQGRKRGGNVIYVFEAEGVKLVHLGDLGHTLTQAQAADIGRVDILCIPVGGTYTVDAAQATQTAEGLQARIVIPMHYRIPGLTIDIAGVGAFLKGKANVTNADELDVTPETLPKEQETLVLKPRP